MDGGLWGWICQGRVLERLRVWCHGRGLLPFLQLAIHLELNLFCGHHCVYYVDASVICLSLRIIPCNPDFLSIKRSINSKTFPSSAFHPQIPSHNHKLQTPAKTSTKASTPIPRAPLPSSLTPSLPRNLLISRGSFPPIIPLIRALFFSLDIPSLTLTHHLPFSAHNPNHLLSTPLPLQLSQSFPLQIFLLLHLGYNQTNEQSKGALSSFIR